MPARAINVPRPPAQAYRSVLSYCERAGLEVPLDARMANTGLLTWVDDVVAGEPGGGMGGGGVTAEKGHARGGDGGGGGGGGGS